MTGKTTIEWTHMPGFQGDVWNPTTGCTRVSAGCDNCYAFALHDKRFKANVDKARSHGFLGPWLLNDDGPITTSSRERGDPMPFPRQYDLPFSHVQLLEERLEVPLRTRKPTCYFVDSMADLFHEDVPDDFLWRVFQVMSRAEQHRFLILTKRPQRMREWVTRYWGGSEDGDLQTLSRAIYGQTTPVAPRSNIWLGTSVEDQASADERIPELIATPAAVRFLSCEPLLGPVELLAKKFSLTWANTLPGIDWVIVGGESGARARPMDLAWARSLRDQCAAVGVSFFMKQLGSKPVLAPFVPQGAPTPRLVRESHGRDMSEWPEDLRIRTWPR